MQPPSPSPFLLIYPNPHSLHSSFSRTHASEHGQKRAGLSLRKDKPRGEPEPPCKGSEAEGHTAMGKTLFSLSFPIISNNCQDTRVGGQRLCPLPVLTGSVWV